ncbi:MAG: hypothetical protein IE933_03530 [Sphingomonadales bacterium]|nr:hypothetical protein [Sphingomonadales bacterium]MBD3772115.1 hypothetical protein [Paracoccaceae bacterium]
MTQPTPSSSADIAVIASSIELATEQGIVARSVLLLPFGEFYGRDGRGPYRLVDSSHAEEVIAATRQFAGNADLLINYDHQSEYAATPGVGGQAKAAGWIDPASLTVASDGIRGDVEWTKPAEAALQAREYRYHSPHFRVHPKTRLITRLVNAGLTNSPNLDLPALASQLAGQSTEEEGNDMTKPVLAAALSSTALAAMQLTATSPDDEVLAAIDNLVADKAEGEKVLASARTALALGADADGEAVLASIASARKAGEPDPAKYVPVAALKEVNDQLAEIREEKVLAMVDQAVAGGKLTPGQKDWAIALGKKDVGELQSFLGTAPTFKGGSLIESNAPGSEKTKLTDEEQAICSQLGLSEDDFLKSRKSNEENA